MFELAVYGNFNIIVMALERISLVMSDPAYQGIFILGVLMSVVIWGSGVVLGRFNGGASNMWQGLVIILVGICIYIGFINQRGDMVVEEHGLSSPRIAIIPDVPEGVRILMGIYNGIIRTIIPVIEASGNVNTPQALDYVNNANGDLFNILRFVFENTIFVPGSETSGEYLNLTIQNYFSDCLLMQVNHPNGRFAFEMFSDGTQITEIIEAGRSYSFQTTRYSTSATQGEQVTCQEAGDQILDELNAVATNQSSPDSTAYNFWVNRCQKAGYYDPDNNNFSGTVQSCQDKTIAFLATLDPQNRLPDTTVLQTFLVSSQINAYLQTHDVEALSSYRMATSLKGEASAAMRWIPILQGAIFSAYLGLLPFLALLIPTVVAIRVCKFIAGIFVFICCWEICDAILYGYAIDMAYGTFRELMNQGLSLKMLWMMEAKSYSALLIFAKMRWAAMGLSAALSAIVIQSSAHVLGSLSGTLGSLGAEAQRAGHEITDPSQRASGMERLTQAAPTEAIINQKGFDQMMGQGYYRQTAEASSVGQFIKNHGDNIQAASDAMGETISQEFTNRVTNNQLIDHYRQPAATDISQLTASRQGRKAIDTATVQFNTPESGATRANPVVMEDGRIDTVNRQEQKGLQHHEGTDITIPVGPDGDMSDYATNLDGTPVVITDGTINIRNGIRTATGKTDNGEFATIVSNESSGEILSADFRPYGNLTNFAQHLRDGNLAEAPYDLVQNRERAVTETVQAIGAYYSRQTSRGGGVSLGGSVGAKGKAFGLNASGSGHFNLSETLNKISHEIQADVSDLENSAEIAEALQDHFDHFTRIK